MTCSTFPLSTVTLTIADRWHINLFRVGLSPWSLGVIPLDFLEQLSYNRGAISSWMAKYRNLSIPPWFHENSLCNLTSPLSLHWTKITDLTKSLRGVAKNTRSENITKIIHWVKNGWLHVVGSFCWDFLRPVVLQAAKCQTHRWNVVQRLLFEIL